MARFFGEWNCSQFLSSMNSLMSFLRSFTVVLPTLCGCDHDNRPLWFERASDRALVPIPQTVGGDRNRHANHPVNAMLNYAYAVLESQVRIATVAQGLDPAIGYLHVCRPGRAALVYD